ncbi:MAG: phosphopyruvate hydratase [bacterium]|nr:phosphopyruvate hydratase [bacterium]
MKIKDIKAREILDSRSNPTIEVKMVLEDNTYAISSVPSGASTGSKESLELRDKDERFHGKGVLKAVKNVNEIIAPNIIGMELNQFEIDKKMLELDGTENKSNLGANAILGVSLCTLKCLAKINDKELFEYVSDGNYNMPIPMVNVINGGAHADNNLDIQEFMLVPIQKKEKERIRCASEIFITLKGLLKDMKLSTGVGDEGGFAPNLENNEKALDLLVEAIEKSNYIPGQDVYLALDAAASEFYDNGLYYIDNKNLTKEELLDYYTNLINKYPIISIEDPFEENDYDSFKKLNEKFNNKIMVVGDDLFVSSTKYLKQGIQNNAGNAILLKANQVGSITEFFETIKLAKENGYKTIISHRSGETLDTFIADLGVGLSLDYIKTGSVSRGERIAKYNRLMEIEEKLN